MTVTEQPTSSAFDTARASTPWPVRLQLLGCRLERGPAATSRVSVQFADPDSDEMVEYRQEGVACPGGDLRLAALATLDAVTRTSGGTTRLELVGVKPVRAFDTNLMVVALIAHRDGITSRVVGTAISDSDQLTGVARATLHAVNRLVAPHLTRLDPFA
jgi:hypothetical protein